MKHKGWFIFAVAAVIAVAGMLLYVSPADAGKLDDAIAQTPTGTGAGMIDPNAAKGFMGISGAPKFFPLYPILGDMGRVDFFFSRRVRRNHGRCRP